MEGEKIIIFLSGKGTKRKRNRFHLPWLKNFTPRSRINSGKENIRKFSRHQSIYSRSNIDRGQTVPCSDAQEPSKRGRYLGYKARTGAPTVLTSCTYIRASLFLTYSTPTPGIRLEGSLKWVSPRAGWTSAQSDVYSDHSSQIGSVCPISGLRMRLTIVCGCQSYQVNVYEIESLFQIPSFLFDLG